MFINDSPSLNRSHRFDLLSSSHRVQDGEKGYEGAQEAVQLPKPLLNDLPASDRGRATYSVWGGTRAGWVLQPNTATQVRHVEDGGAFKGGREKMSAVEGELHTEVRAEEG